MVRTKQQQQEFVRKQQNSIGATTNPIRLTSSNSTQQSVLSNSNQSVPLNANQIVSTNSNQLNNPTTSSLDMHSFIRVDLSQIPSSSNGNLQIPESIPDDQSSQFLVPTGHRGIKKRRLVAEDAQSSGIDAGAIVECEKRKTTLHSKPPKSVSETPTIRSKLTTMSVSQTPTLISQSNTQQSIHTNPSASTTNAHNQSNGDQVQFDEYFIEEEEDGSVADNITIGTSDDENLEDDDDDETIPTISKQAQWQRRKRKKQKLAKYWLLGYKQEAEFYRLSKPNIKCKHCGAAFFIEELPVRLRNKHATVNTFTACCNHGRLHSTLAPFLGTYPTELQKYFLPDSNRDYAMFMEWIRIMNSSFSFASLACNRFNFKTPGVYCYKIQGNIYHKYNEIAKPKEQKDATNGQLYFIDTTEALELRKTDKQFPEKLMPVLEHFEQYIRQNNQFAQSYKLMKEVYNETQLECKQRGIPLPEVKMLFTTQQPEVLKKNNWKKPASNEVCAIIVTNAQGDVPAAQIVVHATGEKQLRNIHPLNSMVEPMLYPLFYPEGRLGWTYTLRDPKDRFSAHHHGGKLFQQWIVNMAAIVEWTRTQYIVHNQKEIAKTSRKNIEDFLRQLALAKNAIVLRQIILPASFLGSQRNLHESFMDAMTIVGATGRPDYFLTFTCNPTDPDIVENLVHQKQCTNNAPDMVMRVFKMKKQQLIDELLGGLFGEVIAYCWVIEFQARGLPHMHILFTMDSKHKLYSPEQVDQVIQAQFPDPQKDPELFNLVATHMVHGPCYYGAPCWEGDKETGKCSKGFPKKFQEITQITENGYPHYQRPDNGRFIRRKGVNLHNGYVIPYSPYLLKRFRAHINLEKVNDIRAIKYIYKYIYKGFDKTCFECYTIGPNGEKLGLNYNEVAAHLEARYLSPVEASCRLFKFPLQQKSHKVEKLDIHLEDGQQFFLETDATKEVLQEVLSRDSKLTAYFKFLQKHPHFECLYLEMPQKCTWDDKNRCWRYRKRGAEKALGRLHAINPQNTELFYFRELLVRFCERGFKEYLTYQGITYSSYAEVALVRQVCEDDNEYMNCLEEASLFRFPKGLRTLFTTILVHCTPKNPGMLWDKFKDDLSEDLIFQYKNRFPMERIYAMTLQKIDEQLQHNNKSLADFVTMPQNIQNFVEILEEDENYDKKAEEQAAYKLLATMNKEQLEIMEFLWGAFVGNTETKLLYIDGPGGTGKSFVLLALYHLGRANGKRICNMAFSGIAATILKMGQTLHKRFNLPLDVGPDSIANIPNQGKEFEELKKVDIFIWDEAPTASKWILEIIDKKLRQIMGCNKPFGGKTIILAGDFRQCLTIKEHATRSEIIDLLIKNSWLWHYFTVMGLSKNMRANQTEVDFAADLLDIGNGIAACNTKTLADEIFGEFFKGNFQEYNNAILSPYNSIVDKYNMEIIERMPGEETTYHSIDSTDPNKPLQLNSEYLKSINIPSLPPHKLKLKKHCILMLMRNLNIRQGLCNGTRLKLMEAKKYVLKCQILTGDRTGEETLIPRITLIEDGKKAYIHLRRLQFPVKHAFAFTINKSQSQTFDKIGIDYTSPPFSHGQTYVALSRARSWDAIKVRLGEEDCAKRQMRNIVWREALLTAN